MNYPLTINGRVYTHFSELAELIKTSPSPQSKEGIGLLQVLLDGVLQEKIQAWAKSNENNEPNEEAQHVLERMNELLSLTEDTFNLPDSVLMERLVSCFGSDYIGRTINIYDYILFEVTALKHGEEDLNTESNDISISDMDNKLAMSVRLEIRRFINETLKLYYEVGTNEVEKRCSSKVDYQLNTLNNESCLLAITHYRQKEDAILNLIAEVAGRRYIIWQKSIRYTPTIRYYANGGSGEMSSQVCEKDVSTPLCKNLFTRENYYFCGWNTRNNGRGGSYKEQEDISISTQTNLYAQWKKSKGTENGHEWVDLGLPSGLKWATCNIGASSPEGCGDYFAWGEIEPKNNYDWRTYRYCNGNGSYDTMTKYCTKSGYGYNGFTDGKTTLELSDDAARVNWGGKWRMPSDIEKDELIEFCSWTWTTQSGVNGYIITSKTNGNSIFLPAAGIRYDTSVVHVGSRGDYWSSSLVGESGSPDNACHLSFDSGYVDWSSHARFFGHTVRAVCP